MYIINHIKKNFTNFLFFELNWNIEKYVGEWENLSKKTENLSPEQEKIKALQDKLEEIKATEQITKKTAEILYKWLTKDPSIKNDPEANETIKLFEKYKVEFEKAKTDWKITQEELNKLIKNTTQIEDKFEYNLWVEYEEKTWEIRENELSNEKLKTITNREFLELPEEKRLQYVTKNHIDSESVASWSINNLEFSFTFDWEYNKDLYLFTTAGQVLPEEVREVNFWWKEYKRDWLKGEFFTSWWERLTIHDNTKIYIDKIWTEEDIFNIREKNKEKFNNFIEENTEYSDEKYKDIINCSLEKWVELKNLNFVIEVFWNNLENLDFDNRKILIEEILTDVNRMRWEDYSDLDDKNFQLEILNKYHVNDWKEIAEKLNITDDDILTFNNKIKIRSQYENIDNFVDLEKLTWNRKKIVWFALAAYKNRDILGANNCTDWVDKVFKQTIWKSVYDTNTIFNWVSSISWWTWLWVKEIASDWDILKINSWDHIILDKPRWWKYWVWRTHSVIALWQPENWILKVVSYPNSKIPPRVEYYDLYWEWRAQKNWKPIRIQQPF